MAAAPWSFVAAQPAAEPPAVRIRAEVADAARAEQLAHTARETVRLLSDWLGAAPFSEILVVAAPIGEAAARHAPGTVAVALRWIELDRDPAAERSLIAGIAAQHWSEATNSPDAERWFGEGVSRYTSTRAIDTLLEGRQYWSTRFFGGFIPFVQRSLPLSPFGGHARGHIPSFSDHPTSADERVDRTVAALFTLERVIGWPALQQGLVEWRAKVRSSGAGAADFASILVRE